MPIPYTIVVRPEWVALQDPTHWLTGPELTTYRAWPSPKRRAEWLAGRLAAKRLIQETFGMPPLTFVIGREGVAPCVVNTAHADVPLLALSLSHSHGLGAATLSDPHREGSAGVDVQRIQTVHPGLRERVFTAGEREQIAQTFGADADSAGALLFWALKEAAIKARRSAWGRSLREIEARLTGAGSAVLDMAGEPPLTAAYEKIGGWWLARAVLPPG